MDLESMLLQYFNRLVYKREDDITILDNNLRFRDADPLDHLEMIMARVREQNTLDIFKDVIRIIEISKME